MLYVHLYLVRSGADKRRRNRRNHTCGAHTKCELPARLDGLTFCVRTRSDRLLIYNNTSQARLPCRKESYHYRGCGMLVGVVEAARRNFLEHISYDTYVVRVQALSITSTTSRPARFVYYASPSSSLCTRAQRNPMKVHGARMTE